VELFLVGGLTGRTPSEYELFSPDLSSGIVNPHGAMPLSPQASEKTLYKREEDGPVGCPLVVLA
jgi:hypothetical protein